MVTASTPWVRMISSVASSSRSSVFLLRSCCGSFTQRSGAASISSGSGTRFFARATTSVPHDALEPEIEGHRAVLVLALDRPVHERQVRDAALARVASDRGERRAVPDAAVVDREVARL